VLEGQSIALGYHAGEDRLVLFLSSGADERQLLLTRRICLGLIRALGDLLERSAGDGQNLPDDIREAVVFIEHQRSIFDLPISGPKSGSQARARLDIENAKLVTAMHIQSSPLEFVLLASAGGERAAKFKFGRRDLHRFVEALKVQAEKAQWDSPLAEGWLGLADDDVTVD
jgi:hypothetical protein